MSDRPVYLFQVATPLGLVVRTTQPYWELIQLKHPEVGPRLREIPECLSSPEQVRRSRQDTAVLLFYRPVGSYHLCVVVK